MLAVNQANPWGVIRAALGFANKHGAVNHVQVMDHGVDDLLVPTPFVAITNRYDDPSLLTVGMSPANTQSRAPVDLVLDVRRLEVGMGSELFPYDNAQPTNRQDGRLQYMNPNGF